MNLLLFAPLRLCVKQNHTLNQQRQNHILH